MKALQQILGNNRKILFEQSISLALFVYTTAWVSRATLPNVLLLRRSIETNEKKYFYDDQQRSIFTTIDRLKSNSNEKVILGENNEQSKIT